MPEVEVLYVYLSNSHGTNLMHGLENKKCPVSIFFKC